MSVPGPSTDGDELNITHRTECRIGWVCFFANYRFFPIFHHLVFHSHTHTQQEHFWQTRKSQKFSLSLRHMCCCCRMMVENLRRNLPKIASMFSVHPNENFSSQRVFPESFSSLFPCWTLSTIFHKFSHPLSQLNSRTQEGRKEKKKKFIQKKRSFPRVYAEIRSSMTPIHLQ